MKKIIATLGVGTMVVLIAMVGQSVQATPDQAKSTHAGGLLLASGSAEETVGIGLLLAGNGDRFGSMSTESCSAVGEVGFYGAIDPMSDYATCEFDLRANDFVNCKFPLNEIAINGVRKHVVVELDVMVTGSCALLPDGVIFGPPSSGSETRTELLVIVRPTIVKPL